MQFRLSLDFWLWLGVGFNLALSIAYCIRSASLGS